MKRFLAIIFLIAGLKAGAQQLPQYTQYTFNELLINPAVTGIESYWDVKAGYRNQWSGLQGSPKTAYLTFSIPLDRDFTLTDYSQMISNSYNPMGRSAANDYSASASHSGLGMSIVSDKIGQINQTHLDALYAYHIRMSDGFNLGVGASLGINNLSLNTSQLTFSNPLDPIVTQGTNSQIKPEAGVGLWGYGAGFFVGASVQQLLPTAVSFASDAGDVSGKTYAQYFLTAGLRVYLSEDVTALPSVVVRPASQMPLSYDANMKIAFRDVFWVGGAYRQNDAVAGSFGFNLNGFLTLGYSYDYTTSQLKSVSGGTHEIMIGILLNNNYNVTSPRHTW
ncbi:type IX secretion system PorP/SprF family membrane protein [Mucilaginibacter gracilis]|uniref:Type IX secretion system PorP/SprF family membrane protein n=1 Tax=Mucilaginibacter gracilis TaxID=423350 RepID=A0A495J1Z9_9SPHI|nr:type IX secretion system membrane protein PorP/SprF [Mucilaginibacter gracilis]RKR82957.1 type IX secretion system PorP/SprF family membrane protein [Mucilaginibacter gracilis]